MKDRSGANSMLGHSGAFNEPTTSNNHAHTQSQDLSMCAPKPEGNQACKHDYNQSQWTPKPVPDNQKRRK